MKTGVFSGKSGYSRYFFSLAVFLFGVMTLAEGGSTFFRYSFAEMVQNNIVPFVLTFNFFSGFVYLFIAMGIFQERIFVRFQVLRIARYLLIAIALVFAGLGIYIFSGGAFMKHTVITMTVRLSFWITINVWLSSRSKSGA